jgi:hypothetical protein
MLHCGKNNGGFIYLPPFLAGFLPISAIVAARDRRGKR